MISTHWKTASIGELCHIVKGTTPIMKAKPGDYPLITMGEEHKAADTYQLDTEAVCVPMISSFGHGKPGLKRVHYVQGKFALSNLLTALVVKNPTELSTQFLGIYLNTFKDQLIVPLQTGAANMSLRPEKLAGVLVHYPLIEEQIQIVRSIDETNELRHLRDQGNKVTKELIPALFHRIIGDPIKNDNNWPTYHLSEISELIRGITFKPTDRLLENNLNGIVCLRTKNVQESIDLDDLIYISRNLVRNPKQFIQNDDILISNANSKELVGKCCFVENLDFPATLGGFITAIRVDKRVIIPKYLYWWMNTTDIQRAFRKLARQTTNIANLPLTKVQSMNVPVPPMSIQNAFIVHVDEMQDLRTKQKEITRLLDHLHNVIISRAFSGLL